MQPAGRGIDRKEPAELPEVLVALLVTVAVKRLDDQQRVRRSEAARFQHSRDRAMKQLVANLRHLRTTPPELFA